MPSHSFSQQYASWPHTHISSALSVGQPGEPVGSQHASPPALGSPVVLPEVAGLVVIASVSPELPPSVPVLPSGASVVEPESPMPAPPHAPQRLRAVFTHSSSQSNVQHTASSSHTHASIVLSSQPEPMCGSQQSAPPAPPVESAGGSSSPSSGFEGSGGDALSSCPSSSSRPPVVAGLVIDVGVVAPDVPVAGAPSSEHAGTPTIPTENETTRASRSVCICNDRYKP